MKLLIIFIALTLILSSCNKSEKDISGIYLKTPSEYTVDSLFIYSDTLQPTLVYNRKLYKYKQRFYNKKTGELLFENNQEWYLDNQRIIFEKIYFDADNNPDDYSHSKSAIENALISFSTVFDGEKIMVEKGVYYEK